MFSYTASISGSKLSIPQLAVRFWNTKSATSRLLALWLRNATSARSDMCSEALPLMPMVQSNWTERGVLFTSTLSAFCPSAAPGSAPLYTRMRPGLSLTVPAGEEMELTATFDPNAHGPDAVGPVNRIIYIQSNASKEPLKLTFTANVVR